ncbi:hypothetical protein [Streptobacillus canis]|uniref:hypothetical protein n=1 Tax=Streptobacillus canis TaxID=2678686 RepID=UPI0012E0E8AA|nr:hypothetical protein [Streptobacillus canis]
MGKISNFIKRIWKGILSNSFTWLMFFVIVIFFAPIAVNHIIRKFAYDDYSAWLGFSGEYVGAVISVLLVFIGYTLEKKHNKNISEIEEKVRTKAKFTLHLKNLYTNFSGKIYFPRQNDLFLYSNDKYTKIKKPNFYYSKLILDNINENEEDTFFLTNISENKIFDVSITVEILGNDKFKPIEYYLNSMDEGETVALYSFAIPFEFKDVEFVVNLTYTSSKKEKVKLKFVETDIEGYFSTVEEVNLFDDDRVYYSPRGESYYIKSDENMKTENFETKILVNFSEYETTMKDLVINDKKYKNGVILGEIDINEYQNTKLVEDIYLITINKAIQSYDGIYMIYDIKEEKEIKLSDIESLVID